MPKLKNEDQKLKKALPYQRWLFLGGLLVGLMIVAGFWWAVQAQDAGPKEAPEAQKILDLQADMPFQILIPSYLPKDFMRESMDIKVHQTGPGGEPMVQLTYHTRNGIPLFIRQWVPINPEMEILAGSRPIETKWGDGWMLKHGEDLVVVWADIGPLRVSIYTYDQKVVDQQHLLAIAENMGPASNRQVFSFVVDPSVVREIPPPPPLEIPVNQEGVQEVDLIVTPGGYSPLRFAVKKGIPVRITFRQLGEVGCGNELNFPISATNLASLQLKSPADKQVLEFTPPDAGEFQFFCGHLMYRGVLTVRE
jgi:hypothetical protein